MPYKFEITGITYLQKPRVVVLDGKLLDGAVTLDSVANLISKLTGKSYSVLVKGPVLGLPTQRDLSISSLTLDLRQEGLIHVEIGDVLVSN